MPRFTWLHSNIERGGGSNLGNRPGKSTGGHKITVALGHCTHTLSCTHKTDKFQEDNFSFLTRRNV